MNEQLLLTPYEAATISDEIYRIRKTPSAKLPDFHLLREFSANRQFEMMHWYEGETGAFGMFDVSKNPFHQQDRPAENPHGRGHRPPGGKGDSDRHAGDGTSNLRFPY